MPSIRRIAAFVFLAPLAIPLDVAAHDTSGYLYDFAHSPTSGPLVDAIPLPPDLRRESLAPASFSEWVRHLPVEAELHAILDWEGTEVLSAAYAYAILDIDVRRYQECADIAMRLWAEFTWAKGGTPDLRIESGKPNPRQGFLRTGIRRTFDDYLAYQYMYASSNVLKRDLQDVPSADVQPGDLVVMRRQGSSQGHVFVVMDVAVSGRDGRKKVVIAHSNIPAQSFHVVPNPPPYVGWDSYRDEFSALSVEDRQYRCWMDWGTFFDHTKYDENGQAVLRRFPSRY